MMPTYDTTTLEARIERLERATEVAVQALEAEIEQLKAANARGQEYSQQLFDENERLKAQVKDLSHAYVRATGPFYPAKEHID